jgi:hypothetical protein
MRMAKFLLKDITCTVEVSIPEAIKDLDYADALKQQYREMIEQHRRKVFEENRVIDIDPVITNVKIMYEGEEEGEDKPGIPAENIFIHDAKQKPIQSVFLHPFNVEVLFVSDKAAEGSPDKDCFQIHVRDNVTGKQTIVYEITK